jgi:hypothetical protein
MSKKSSKGEKIQIINIRFLMKLGHDENRGLASHRAPTVYSWTATYYFKKRRINRNWYQVVIETTEGEWCSGISHHLLH